MTYWYKIVFNTPIHVGDRGVGVETVCNVVHSTTLHGAIINALLMLERISPNEVDSISFRLNTPSPILTVHGVDEPLVWIRGLHIFFRKQLRELLTKSISEFSNMARKLKKIQLVHPSFLNRNPRECQLVHGYVVCENETYRIIETKHYGYAIVPEKLAVADGTVLFEYETRPRNVIDRLTGAAEPYHLSLVRYTCPLLLGIEVLSENMTINDIKAALRLLGDIGTGGERTYGFGKFVFEKTRGIDQTLDKYSSIVVQGLYSPPYDKLDKILKKSIYTSMIHGFRSGYTGLVRKPVLVLREGSIIQHEEYCKGITVVDEVSFDRVIRSFDPIVLTTNLAVG